jgi:hypothetical protein
MTKEPEDGVRYSLHIGDSFKENNEEDKIFHTIQCKCVLSQDCFSLEKNFRLKQKFVLLRFSIDNFVPESADYGKGEITVSHAHDSTKRIRLEYPMVILEKKLSQFESILFLSLVFDVLLLIQFHTIYHSTLTINKILGGWKHCLL